MLMVVRQVLLSFGILYMYMYMYMYFINKLPRPENCIRRSMHSAQWANFNSTPSCRATGQSTRSCWGQPGRRSGGVRVRLVGFYGNQQAYPFTYITPPPNLNYLCPTPKNIYLYIYIYYREKKNCKLIGSTFIWSVFSRIEVSWSVVSRVLYD